MTTKDSNKDIDKRPVKRETRYDSKIELVLYTRSAQSMFRGNWKAGQHGILQFADICKDLYHSYRADDPYAHLVILSLYQQLIEAIAKCEEIEKQLQLKFDNLKGLKLVALHGEAEWRESLEFATFNPYLAARLLGIADEIFLRLDALHRFGLTKDEDEFRHKTVKRILQDIFSYARKWRRTGVTRKDIFENNSVAIKAKEFLSDLGELPDDVLHKRIELNLLPKI